MTIMDLIYFTIGYDTFYVKLLEFCILTLRLHNDMSNIKILVLCSFGYRHNVEPLLQDGLVDYIHITSDNMSAMQSSIRKVEIFDFPYINDFHRILYLDSDIICLGNIGVIFDSIGAHENKLHVCVESHEIHEHNLIYFGFQDYTQDQIEYFFKNQIHVFNCGQFGFVNSQKMKNHFTCVINMINNNMKPFFYEQSFMNFYFNINMLTIEDLNKHICIMSRHHMTHENRLVHFANADTPSWQKLELMKKVYAMRTNAT